MLSERIRPSLRTIETKMPVIRDGRKLDVSGASLFVIALAGSALAVIGVIAFRRILAYQEISPEAREAIHDFLDRAA